MTYGFIYKIPFPNKKCYIGLTTRTIEERWYEHNNCAKTSDTRCLYNALRKYNIVNTFQMIVIDTAETQEELCEKEIAHIEIHNSHYKTGYGYNMTDGGEGTAGYEYTEEDRQKQSEAIKKYFEDPEARRKTSEAQKIRYEDPEERRKNSEAQKKYNKDNPEKGKKHSEALKKYFEDNPEARQQMSEVMKKRYKDNPEASKAHGEYMKQYYDVNPEARQKQSEILKNYYKDNPEARQKISETKKKHFEDPKAKRKHAELHSEYKPFDVLDKKDDRLIASFNYQFEATEYLQKKYEIKKTRIKISEVLQGKRNSSHGFKFKYKEPEELTNDKK